MSAEMWKAFEQSLLDPDAALSKVSVQRSELLRVIGQLAPHMGKAGTGDAAEFEPFGSVRVAVDAHDRIVLWTGDAQTYACGSIAVIDYHSPVLSIFDIAASDAVQIPRVFAPSKVSNDHKDMWFNGLFQLSLVQEEGNLCLRIDETFDFPAQGRSFQFKVSLVPSPETDIYPDFPEFMASILAQGSAPGIAAYPPRECVKRILSAVVPEGRIRTLHSKRSALIIGGTAAFTAILPAKVTRPLGWEVQTIDDDFDDVVRMLQPYIREDTPHRDERLQKIRESLRTTIFKATEQ